MPPARHHVIKSVKLVIPAPIRKQTKRKAKKAHREKFKIAVADLNRRNDSGNLKFIAPELKKSYKRFFKRTGRLPNNDETMLIYANQDLVKTGRLSSY